MSLWNHLLCDACWKAREPHRIPVRVAVSSAGRCCACSKATSSGIYVRVDPNALPCKGKGPEHES